MNWERPYYFESSKPYIYFAIFGMESEELNVSKTKHRVDEIPDGIEIKIVSKAEHKEYVENFYSNYFGEVLKCKDFNLYERVLSEESCCIISGEILNDKNLLYLKNIIGIIQSIFENGAYTVLDLQTIEWYNRDEWYEDFFRNEEFDAHKYVKIFSSHIQEENYRLQTRGMRKFGRPDIVIYEVPKNEIEEGIEILNQIIYYQSLGSFVPRFLAIHTKKNSYEITGNYHGDFDNTDFNNEYYEFAWE